MSLNQFDRFKAIYVNNVIRGELPILPAYFFYLEHTDTNLVLSQQDFERYFSIAINGYRHPISFDIIHPVIDIDNVYNILNSYFDLQYLYNDKQELIKII